jgi:hypothetical protein
MGLVSAGSVRAIHAAFTCFLPRETTRDVGSPLSSWRPQHVREWCASCISWNAVRRDQWKNEQPSEQHSAGRPHSHHRFWPDLWRERGPGAGSRPSCARSPSTCSAAANQANFQTTVPSGSRRPSRRQWRASVIRLWRFWPKRLTPGSTPRLAGSRGASKKPKSGTMPATSEDRTRFHGEPALDSRIKGNRVEYGKGDTPSRRVAAR